MITRLKNNGENMTLELDKSLIASLGVNESIELDARVVEGVLVVKPLSDSDDKLDSVLKRIDTRYAEGLKELAK